MPFPFRTPPTAGALSGRPGADGSDQNQIWVDPVTGNPYVAYNGSWLPLISSTITGSITESQVTGLPADLAARLLLTGGTLSGALSGTTSSWSGSSTAQAFVATGLTGATSASRYVGGTVSGPPLTGSFNAGDFAIDETGVLWVFNGTSWVGGSGFNWRNQAGGFVIQATTLYNVNDALIDFGGSWRCILSYTSAGTPVVPHLDTTHWAAIAQQGATGPTGSTGATGAAGAGAELAYAEVTGVSVTFTNTTAADWTGLSITFVAPASGQAMLEVGTTTVQQSIAGDGCLLNLTDNANALLNYDYRQAYAANASMGTISVKKRLTGLTPGNSYTYKVRINAVTGGSVVFGSFNAAGGLVAFIRASGV